MMIPTEAKVPPTFPGESQNDLDSLATGVVDALLEEVALAAAAAATRDGEADADDVKEEDKDDDELSDEVLLIIEVENELVNTLVMTLMEEPPETVDVVRTILS